MGAEVGYRGSDPLKGFERGVRSRFGPSTSMRKWDSGGRVEGCVFVAAFGMPVGLAGWVLVPLCGSGLCLWDSCRRLAERGGPALRWGYRTVVRVLRWF